MLNLASAPSRTEKYYHNHPAEAFEEGFIGKGKVRRHGEHYYHRSHFFLPAATSIIIRLLRRYFNVLDSEQDVPPDHRYRQTKWEFAETAIGIFDDIRRQITMGEHLEGGSDYFCPIPWVVVGPGNGRYGRNNFPNGLREIFDYYAPFMEQGGFNCVSIDRPECILKGRDKLQILCDIYRHSANFILTCAILFLFDLIIHGGPDCLDFQSAFTNDNRISIPEDTEAWVIARQAIFGLEDRDINVYTGQTGWLQNRKSQRIVRQQHHNNLSQLHYRNNVRLYSSHWEVIVEDVDTESGDALLSGETVREYRSLKPKPTTKPYYTTPQSGIPEEDEDIEEPKNPYQDLPKKEMTGMEYGDAIRKMYHL